MLPINISGLGVRQSQEQYRAAYVGSVLASNDLVQKITNQRASDRVFKELYASLEPFNFNSYKQKIQEAKDTQNFSELLRNQSANREKARLQSLCLPHYGALLAAPPVPALGLHLSPSEFQISVVAVYEVERKCHYCRSGTLEIFGDHAVICHGRGDAISRHDRIRDRFVSLCSAANLSPVIEKRNLIAGNISRPGDVFLPSWKSGRPAALDVTVTSPLQPNIINHAAYNSGYVNEAAKERKYAQHEKIALSKEFRCFLLLLSHWVVCQLLSRKR